LSYHSEAPAYWGAEQAGDPDSELGTDQCVIGGEHFFVRGLITIPVCDAEDDFAWGVWVSPSEQSFVGMSENWTRSGRERMGPMFGWLATNLPAYRRKRPRRSCGGRVTAVDGHHVLQTHLPTARSRYLASQP
jgi:hypothetical protein